MSTNSGCTACGDLDNSNTVETWTRGYEAGQLVEAGHLRAAVEAQRELRLASRSLLAASTAKAIGQHRPVDEARAWDRFALAIDAAEDFALDT